nr:NADH dehydrogenase subunit 5 [Actornithophilus gracilis]
MLKMNMKKLCFFPFFFSIIIFLTLLSHEKSIFLEFPLMELSSFFFSLGLILDPYSLVFTFTVGVIFSSIFLYSFYYLEGEVNMKRFLILLSLFVFSMLILILSGNFFSSLIGWDGLGVTSVLLIFFFYSSSSLKAGTLTFLMNRIGDCFFILCFFFVCVVSSNVTLTSGSLFSNSALPILIILMSITKSAQLPFSSWLPAAMEAPTPVSALVHSSTLVTAGIYMLFRYSLLWELSNSAKKFLCVLAISTLFLASISGVVEIDLKKIIALSTLSQLGFIMFCLSVGMAEEGFFHLIMHAFFKALLFMAAGYVIHSSSLWQDIRILHVSYSPNIFMIMVFSLLALSGLPFLSGFYSKDKIVDVFQSHSFSLSLFVLMMVSLLMTIFYSFRVIFYLSSAKISWSSMSDDTSSMVVTMKVLLILSCIGGSMMSWVLFLPEYLFNNSKILLLFALFLSSMGVWFWSSKSFNMIFSSLLFLSMFNQIYSSAFFKISHKYMMCSEVSTLLGNFNIKLTSYLLESSSKINNTSKNFLGNSEFLFICFACLVTLVVFFS